MNYALKPVAYVGGEVDDGAEERIGGATIPMTVEAGNTTEEEIAEIVGYGRASGNIHRWHVFLSFERVFITVGDPERGS